MYHILQELKKRLSAQCGEGYGYTPKARKHLLASTLHEMLEKNKLDSHQFMLSTQEAEILSACLVPSKEDMSVSEWLECIGDLVLILDRACDHSTWSQSCSLSRHISELGLVMRQHVTADAVILPVIRETISETKAIPAAICHRLLLVELFVQNWKNSCQKLGLLDDSETMLTQLQAVSVVKSLLFIFFLRAIKSAESNSFKIDEFERTMDEPGIKIKPSDKVGTINCLLEFGFIPWHHLIQSKKDRQDIRQAYKCNTGLQNIQLGRVSYIKTHHIAMMQMGDKLQSIAALMRFALTFKVLIRKNSAVIRQRIYCQKVIHWLTSSLIEGLIPTDKCVILNSEDIITHLCDVVRKAYVLMGMPFWSGSEAKLFRVLAAEVSLTEQLTFFQVECLSEALYYIHKDKQSCITISASKITEFDSDTQQVFTRQIIGLSKKVAAHPTARAVILLSSLLDHYISYEKILQEILFVEDDKFDKGLSFVRSALMLQDASTPIVMPDYASPLWFQELILKGLRGVRNLQWVDVTNIFPIVSLLLLTPLLYHPDGPMSERGVDMKFIQRIRRSIIDVALLCGCRWVNTFLLEKFPYQFLSYAKNFFFTGQEARHTIVAQIDEAYMCDYIHMIVMGNDLLNEADKSCPDQIRSIFMKYVSQSIDTQKADHSYMMLKAVVMMSIQHPELLECVPDARSRGLFLAQKLKVILSDGPVFPRNIRRYHGAYTPPGEKKRRRRKKRKTPNLSDLKAALSLAGFCKEEAGENLYLDQLMRYMTLWMRQDSQVECAEVLISIIGPINSNHAQYGDGMSMLLALAIRLPVKFMITWVRLVDQSAKSVLDVDSVLLAHIERIIFIFLFDYISNIFPLNSFDIHHMPIQDHKLVVDFIMVLGLLSSSKYTRKLFTSFVQRGADLHGHAPISIEQYCRRLCTYRLPLIRLVQLVVPLMKNIDTALSVMDVLLRLKEVKLLVVLLRNHHQLLSAKAIRNALPGLINGAKGLSRVLGYIELNEMVSSLCAQRVKRKVKKAKPAIAKKCQSACPVRQENIESVHLPHEASSSNDSESNDLMSESSLSDLSTASSVDGAACYSSMSMTPHHFSSADIGFFRTDVVHSECDEMHEPIEIVSLSLTPHHFPSPEYLPALAHGQNKGGVIAVPDGAVDLMSALDNKNGSLTAELCIVEPQAEAAHKDRGYDLPVSVAIKKTAVKRLPVHVVDTVQQCAEVSTNVPDPLTSRSYSLLDQASAAQVDDVPVCSVVRLPLMLKMLQGVISLHVASHDQYVRCSRSLMAFKSLIDCVFYVGCDELFLYGNLFRSPGCWQHHDLDICAMVVGTKQRFLTKWYAHYGVDAWPVKEINDASKLLFHSRFIDLTIHFCEKRMAPDHFVACQMSQLGMPLSAIQYAPISRSGKLKGQCYFHVSVARYVLPGSSYLHVRDVLSRCDDCLIALSGSPRMTPLNLQIFKVIITRYAAPFEFLVSVLPKHMRVSHIHAFSQALYKKFMQAYHLLHDCHSFDRLTYLTQIISYFSPKPVRSYQSVQLNPEATEFQPQRLLVNHNSHPPRQNQTAGRSR